MIVLVGCGDLLQEPDTGTGDPLTAPLRVRLSDRDGRPVPRLRVEWTLLAGSGEAEPRNAFSDANGIAETTWILGPGTGPQELRAVIGGGLPTVFVATAVGP